MQDNFWGLALIVGINVNYFAHLKPVTISFLHQLFVYAAEAYDFKIVPWNGGTVIEQNLVKL